jgi:hypothetical protein
LQGTLNREVVRVAPKEGDKDFLAIEKWDPELLSLLLERFSWWLIICSNYKSG